MKKRDYQDRAKELKEWYESNRRPLPWRESTEPYRIWISEVMLQQTTVAAVIPYYHRFLSRFPNLEALANASLTDVLQMWAGLGYYSRARSLHKAAVELHKFETFPKSHVELLQFPGFGPYTARAVSSLAFGEPVGVVDGNVIRVLCRLLDLDLEWWKPKARNELQLHADQLAKAHGDSAVINQGLMELGATICTPVAQPSCLICPWTRSCLARKSSTIPSRPKAKPRRTTEFWTWQVHLVESQRRGQPREVLLIENNYAPFLKGHLIPLGKVRKEIRRPTQFDLKGSVTHHEIFVKINAVTRVKTRNEEKKLVESAKAKSQWIAAHDIPAFVPSSLVRKALDGLIRI